MRVRWTGPAKRDFLGICDWIDQSNQKAAERIGRRVLDAVERLADTPLAGRVGRMPGTRELVVPGLPYIVVYADDRERHGAVVVLRVIHAAMLWPPKQ